MILCVFVPSLCRLYICINNAHSLLQNRALCFVNRAIQPEELYRFIFSDHISAKDGRVWDETTRGHLIELISMSVEELDHMVIALLSWICMMYSTTIAFPLLLLQQLIVYLRHEIQCFHFYRCYLLQPILGWDGVTDRWDREILRSLWVDDNYATPSRKGSSGTNPIYKR